MKINFGARVIITAPDEGNEEYQGRLGVMVREFEANAIGLKSYQVAFEGDAYQPRFYARELTLQPEAVKEVIVKKIVLKPVPLTKEVVRVAVAVELKRLAEKLAG